jgi:hypothetical protein
MSFLRMAGQALKPLLPSSAPEALLSYAPDVAFATMAAMSAPKDTSPLERIGIGATDALMFGLAPSILGRAAGRGIGRNVFKMDNDALHGAMNVGEMAFQMTPPFLGVQNPALSAAFEREARTQQELAERQKQQEEHHQQEALLGLAYGGGMTLGGLSALSGRAPGPLDLSRLG